MVLVDSSAWIEFLRDTGSAAHHAVHTAVADGTAATTDAVLLEILIGTRPALIERVTRLLANQQFVAQEPMIDALAGADAYHACRTGGFTPRSNVDCLIAAIAMRVDVPVLHCGRDFDALARFTPLEVVST